MQWSKAVSLKVPKGKITWCLQRDCSVRSQCCLCFSWKNKRRKHMGKTKVCWRRDFWKVNGHVGRRPLTFCRGQVKRLGANKWAGHPALQAHVIVRGEASDKGGKNDWHLQDATFIPWLSIFLQLVARREWQQPTDNSFSIQSNTKTLNNT